VTDELIRDERITAMGLLAEACGGLAARLSVQLAEHHLAPVEFEVLLRLARSPEGRLRLEHDGLVCRQACPTDRRSSYAVITATGRTRLAALLPGHLALIEEWFTGRLTPDQLTALLDGLRVVRDAVRPDAAANALDEAPAA